jgi:hypothetical protein
MANNIGVSSWLRHSPALAAKQFRDVSLDVRQADLSDR